MRHPEPTYRMQGIPREGAPEESFCRGPCVERCDLRPPFRSLGGDATRGHGRTMSATRMQRHTVALPVLPAQAFALLVTHSAVRAWWLADRAVILARSGGIWVAAWGREEDAPDYVTAARISVYDPPQRLVLSDFVYGANEALPSTLLSGSNSTSNQTPPPARPSRSFTTASPWTRQRMPSTRTASVAG